MPETTDTTTGTTDNFLRRTPTDAARGVLPTIAPVVLGDDASRNLDHTIVGAAHLIAWMQLSRESAGDTARYADRALAAMRDLSDAEVQQVILDLSTAHDTIDYILALLVGHLRKERPAMVAKMVSDTVAHMVTEALRETERASAATDAAARTRPTNPDLN